MLADNPNKRARSLVYLIVLGLALYSTRTVSSQGVAVPTRRARIQPKAQIDRPLPKVNFEDVAARVGLSGFYSTGEDKEKKYILEITGSGVALIDYNNDGFQDVFLVNGTKLEGFPQGKEPTNHLYRNNRDGSLTDVTASANLVRSGWGQGVCA